MKLRTIFFAVLALWGGGSMAGAATQATVVGRPVVWSIRFDAERLRSGVGQGLFANLDPVLTALSGDKSSTPGGKPESLAIFGFQPKKDNGKDFPFVADLTFSAEGGGISRRFEAVSKKRDVPIEDVAGYPTMHFKHQGREVWIAKFNDARVFVSTSRGLLEQALAPGADGLSTAVPPQPGEMLSGNLDVEPLLAGNQTLHDSELLRLLRTVDFHVLTQGDSLDVDASAQLDNERTARRAARMIDGMVSAIALHDASGIPWDERLALKQDGARLSMQLHLEPQEAKKLFDSFAREIENHTKAAIRGE